MKRRLRKRTGIVLSAVILAGCLGNPTTHNAARMANADLAQEGSPYRWAVTDVSGGALLERRLIGTTAPTTAGEILAADILDAIRRRERRFGGAEKVVALETRLVSRSEEKTVEVWVVARGEKSVAYLVEMMPSPRKGTKISVNGPWE